MKKILAIFLTMLILASNSGVVFATHYCMGDIANVSIGFSTEAHDCEMAKMGGMCEHDLHEEEKSKDCSMNPVDCCSNDFIQIQLNETYNSPVQIDAQLKKAFLPAFTVVYLNLYNFQQESKADFVDYSPPLLPQDLPVLFQSFLI